MARKVITALMTEQKAKEFNLVETYMTKKQEFDRLDKEVKELSNLVKAQMKEKDLTAYTSNGYKLQRIESQRVTWKEEALLAKVKSYNKSELVKKVEQVDVAALEQAIINNEIDINDLKECQNITQVVSLKMTKVKEKSE